MILPELTGPKLHLVDKGEKSAPAVVFAHALGMDMRMWDGVIKHLPEGVRVITLDLRGHGQSPCPDGEYPMGDLVADVARALDRAQVKDCVFVGLSLGGMIAQGLAAERLELVRAVVLSNTATKIATPEIWDRQIKLLGDDGMKAIVDTTIERWFSRATQRNQPDVIASAKAKLLATPLTGYLGTCAAIAQTDLYESTARLRLPCLAIAGSQDSFIPADLMRETADLIPGSRFKVMRNTGHLPPLEAPEDYAALIADFLRDIGSI